MNLFSEEIINITRIYAVPMFNEKVLERGKKLWKYEDTLPSYELVYRFEGENKVFFNGEEFDVSADDILYLPKRDKNSQYSVYRKQRGMSIDIYFDTDIQMPDKAIVLSAKNPELRTLFMRLYNIWSTKKIGYYSEAMAIFYKIINKISCGETKYLSKNQQDKLELAAEYMEKNYCNRNFDYKELANAAGLSYSYFKTLFISKYKMSPTKYVTMLRVRYAQELLITKRYTITEIAKMCGFEDVAYFSNVFKKTTGVSPKNFDVKRADILTNWRTIDTIVADWNKEEE